MAGTWMWWIIKGFSVWMGKAVSESQTRTLYAISFLWFNQCWEYVRAVWQRSASWLHPTQRKKGCVLYRFRTFHIKSAAAIHTKTWCSTESLRSALRHSSHPWLVSELLPPPRSPHLWIHFSCVYYTWQWETQSTLLDQILLSHGQRLGAVLSLH